ncbi:MAG: molybdenum cofactor guanylyltransferase [Pirellulales bacterium]
MQTGGIVLCGGESRRMGRPKAWLPVGPEAMLQRVVRIVGEVVAPVVVVGAPQQELPELPPEVRLVRDARRGRGPLQGLAAGLGALEPPVEAAYVSGCDVPLLRPAFVRHVVESLGDADVGVPYTDGHYHPLAAVYRTRILAEVERLLAADRLRPFFLFEAAQVRTLGAEELCRVDPGLDSLRNVNTREDYLAALRDLGIEPGD